MFGFRNKTAAKKRLTFHLPLHHFQRLLPARDGKSRIAALEILKSTLRTRGYLEKGDQEGKILLDAMRDGDTEGMQHFDRSIEQLIRAGTIEPETGLAYATNPGHLGPQLADIAGEPPTRRSESSATKEIRMRARTGN